MQYIDNFLPKSVLDRLQHYITNLDWYIGGTAYSNDVVSFYHLVKLEEYNECAFKEISTIVAGLIGDQVGKGLEDVLRIRYGLIIKNSEKSNTHMKHLDYDDLDNISATLYLNDNNGYMYVYDNDKVVDKIKPKTNRLVILDGIIEHATSTPTDVETRVAVTVNFRNE